MEVNDTKKFNTLVWPEYFRPKLIKDMVLPLNLKQNFIKMVSENNVPNMLLYSSSPGVGKTTLAKAICNEIGADYKYINVSSENGIDTLRGSISKFASTKSFSGNQKIVIMDECLEENEMIRIGTVDDWKPIKLKDLEFFKEYPIVSMDIDTGELFNDVGELISSKEDDIYEIELGDATTIKVTKDHPIMIKTSRGIEQVTIKKTLGVGDNVICFNHSITYNTKKIVCVKRIGYGTVRNLNVKNKHTFITSNGIVTHNCDGATLNLQQGLRSSIEQFHKVCRFIFTCNYVSKIIEPLRSRCQEFDMNFTDEKTKSEMMPLIKKRIMGILKKKNVDFVEETIDNLVLKYYPDMRKMIQICQQYSNVNNFIDNNIFDFAKIDSELYEYILEKKFVKARTYIIQKNYNFSELYTDLYKNFVPRLPAQKQPNVIIVLADYQFKHSQVVDQEINFSACLLEIMSNI